MNHAAPKACRDLGPTTGPQPASRRTGAPEIDLLVCIRSLGGWVAAEGLASPAALDDLVARGLLETWPGRHLYRIPAGGAS